MKHTAPATTGPVADAVSNHAVVTGHHVELERRLKPYLDGQGINKQRLIDEAEFISRRMASDCFELGKRLLVLKEICEHGEFQDIIETRFRIGARWGRVLLEFAHACVALRDASKGLLDFNTLKRADAKKMCLLGNIAEVYADELSDSGTIDGDTVDELLAYSRDELAARVRQLEAKVSDGRDQLAKRDEKLATIDSQLRELREHKPGFVCTRSAELRRAIANAAHQFRSTCPRATDPTPAEITELFALKEFVQRAATILCEHIEQRWPEVHDLDNADAIRAARHHAETVILGSRIDDRPLPPAAEVHDIDGNGHRNH